jgi:toxin CcdB
MAQFDVYQNPNPASKKHTPYLLDVQNDLFDALTTRVVVPLLSDKSMRAPATKLNPALNINGKVVYMSTAEIAGVPQSAIGKYVCSLSVKRSEIINALDFLISGF